MAITKAAWATEAKTAKINDKELFSRIQKRAYELYLKKGCRQGSDLDDWLRAEREIKRELGL